MRSNSLCGIERPGCLFKYNIEMIVKAESVTNSDPEYVQFMHTFVAGYYIRMGKLSFPMSVVNNYFQRLCIVWFQIIC